MSLHSEARKERQKFAERHVRRAKGGRVHSDEAEDKVLIKKELRSAKIVPKKAGGSVRGAPPVARLDKRARGGKVKKHHGGVKIIVHAGGGAGGPPPGPDPASMALGAKMAASRMGGPAGPMGGPPPGGGAPPMPMGAPPPRPPMPMANGPMPPGLHAKGGRVSDKESAAGERYGERGGEGRELREGLKPPPFKKGGMVKVKEHVRRKRGGALC